MGLSVCSFLFYSEEGQFPFAFCCAGYYSLIPGCSLHDSMDSGSSLCAVGWEGCFGMLVIPGVGIVSSPAWDQLRGGQDPAASEGLAELPLKSPPVSAEAAGVQFKHQKGSNKPISC